MLSDAVRTYHDLLTDLVAADSQAALEDEQHRRGLAFGARPLCTVLRPRFLTSQQYRFLRQRVAVLVRALGKAHEAALADAAFRAQFRLSPDEEEVVRHDPGFPSPMPTSRFDSFWADDGALKFTEYNAETPAGAAYGDLLGEVFLTLPVMRAFHRRYHAVPIPARPGVLNALLTAFASWRGTSEKPRVAILDWREVPTYTEFVLFEQYFHSHGLECAIVDPRDADYRDGKLRFGDFHATLIYKRVLISELLERGGPKHPVVRAVLDGAVCMANPFRCKVLYKKASLAALSDERNHSLYSGEEKEVIDAHVPWTRVVEARKTTFGGRPIDLVPFVLANRERVVLKPNDDYGGKGIVLGWLVDDPTWEQAVQTALATPYVAQEKVVLPTEPFPAWTDGALRVGDRMLDTAPFVVHGDYVDGCLTRISSDPLLNVTAGGGSTVPTFLVEPR